MEEKGGGSSSSSRQGGGRWLNKARGGGGYGGARAVRWRAWRRPRPSVPVLDRIHVRVGLTRPPRVTRRFVSDFQV